MNSAVWTSNNPIFMIFRHAFRRDISHLPRLRSRFCINFLIKCNIAGGKKQVLFSYLNIILLDMMEYLYFLMTKGPVISCEITGPHMRR